MEVLDQAGATGMLSFNASPGATVEKVKGIIKELDIFMKLVGDPDVRSAMERMGQLQSLGIAPQGMQSAASTLKAYARLAGTSVDDIMATSGTYGAQIAAQTGALPSYGLNVGAMAPGIINAGIQLGQYTQQQAALLGGKEGMSQSLTQMVLNQTQQHLGGVGIAAFTQFKDGKAVFNRDAFSAYMQTGQAPGGAQTLIQAGEAALNQMTAAQQTQVLMNSRFLAGEAMGMIKTPEQQIMLSRAINEQIRQSMGPDVTMEQALFGQFGEQGRVMGNFLSRDSLLSARAQMNQSRRTIEEARKQAFRERNTLTARIGTAMAETWDSIVSYLPFDSAAESEQAAAAEAAGEFFMRGMTEGPAFGANASRTLSGLIRTNQGAPADPSQATNDPALLAESGLEMHNRILETAKDLGFEVRTLETLRSPERQKIRKEKGFSKTLNSQHMHGKAVDYWVKGVPYKTENTEIIKEKMAQLTKKLEEKYPGMYRNLASIGDFGHFEVKNRALPGVKQATKAALPRKTDRYVVAEMRRDPVLQDTALEYLRGTDKQIKEALDDAEMYQRSFDAMARGESKKSSMTAAEKEAALEDLYDDAVIGSDSFDFGKFRKMPIEDRAAVLKYVMESSDSHAKNARLHLDDYGKLAGAVKKAQAAVAMQRSNMGWLQATKTFEFGKGDSKIFGDTLAGMYGAMQKAGIKNMSAENFAAISADLLKSGVATSAKDVVHAFKHHNVSITDKQAATFHDAFKENYETFSNRASSDLMQNIQQKSEGEVTALISAGIKQDRTRRVATQVRAEKQNPGMFSSEEDIQQAGQISQRYLDLADTMMRDMGAMSDKKTEEMRSQIAHDLASADRSQMLDLHNSGGKGGSLFGQKVSTNTAVMVQILKNIEKNTKKGD
jgi:hypothetical protein